MYAKMKELDPVGGCMPAVTPLDLPMQSDPIFDVHTLGAYMHIYSKYEGFMFKPVAMRGVDR